MLESQQIAEILSIHNFAGFNLTSLLTFLFFHCNSILHDKHISFVFTIDYFLLVLVVWLIVHSYCIPFALCGITSNNFVHMHLWFGISSLCSDTFNSALNACIVCLMNQGVVIDTCRVKTAQGSQWYGSSS
ncbi:Protein of unknown function [Gryllus bimaculatus]|nr:Protein of unknown function [Gryllus bimaculatus]